MTRPDLSWDTGNSPVAMVLPGGQRITLMVVPLDSVRGAWPARPDGPISRVLTQAELAVSGMHAVLERRLAHLAGRIAAKLALCSHLQDLGHSLAPLDVGLTQMLAGPEQGRPVAQLPAGVPACDVSITHSHGFAMAVVTTGGRVGVDLERVVPRAAAFVDEVFTQVERTWLEGQSRLHQRAPDELWNLGWCLKEALVKCTGQGLRAALQQVTFSGWREAEEQGVQLAPLTEGPDAFVRVIHLDLPGRRELAVSGLLVSGQGYALAVLHDTREDWRRVGQGWRLAPGVTST
ncbi:4'-phosphopantetheinyl transferase family protein [Corallococcus terminator]